MGNISAVQLAKTSFAKYYHHKLIGSVTNVHDYTACRNVIIASMMLCRAEWQPFLPVYYYCTKAV